MVFFNRIVHMVEKILWKIQAFTLTSGLVHLCIVFYTLFGII